MAWENIQNLEERNRNQKKVYINLDNVDKLFDVNDTEILCYDKIFNLCQKYITMYMKFTSNFELKKELANSAICKLYIHFKRTLNKMQEKNTNPEQKPELVFYLSQFYYYVHLTARNEVYMHNSKLKNSPQFIEFRNDVDYSQPIETYINSLEDIDAYIPVNEKIVLTANDYNRDNKKTEDLQVFDNEVSFNQILKKIKDYFTDEEISLIKDVYNGNMKPNSKQVNVIKDKLSSNVELYKILLDCLSN